MERSRTSLEEEGRIEEGRALAPLYLAAFMVLFCGISAVNSTVEDPRLTFFSTLLIAVGVGVSHRMRVQGADQRFVVWLASGMAALLFLLQPFYGSFSRGSLFGMEHDPFSSSGIGVVLEWATILYSFTLLTNHSLLFSIVPSMALIGLMSSENLNPEMVTYFLGFVLSTVFLMGYQSHLERAAEGQGTREGLGAAYRPFLVLSAVVVAGAFLIGQVASAPLKFVGRQVFSVAANSIPSAPASFLPLDLKGQLDTMSLSGHTPNLSGAEMMRVKSRVARYWRGAVFERYTGVSWRSNANYHSIDTSRRPEESGSLEKIYRLDPRDRLKDLKSREILNQTFSTSSFDKTMYAASEPRRFEGPMSGLSATMTLTARADWGQNNLTYHVTSLISNATPDQLRRAPSWKQITARDGGFSTELSGESLVPPGLNFGAFMRGLIEDNTRLNRSLPRRVREEAEKITRGKTSDYDRALAIDQHLKQNYIYTLEPPLLPAERDATDFFLFDARQGYCEQFANAMAVMLRTLGIPARVAVGYAPGEFDRATQEWVVRELDAHAWVEVYFPEYGWITFDPTGGVRPEQPGFSLRKILASVTRFINSREFLPTVVLLLIVSVFGYAVKAEAYDRFLRSHVEEAVRRWRTRGSPDPRWAVERHYHALQKLLQRRGVPLTPNQTPHEIQEAALARYGEDGGIAAPLRQMTRLYTEAAYSGRELPPGSDRASEAWLDQVRQELKTHARR
ncbi:MAG: DUF3488 and transglutaminase-like domain-containing protein [Armatimonadetes bacterium]|nr:DUF3488 and transglutaminase-like domain-containing protein [Armatimonadota bacterium]